MRGRLLPDFRCERYARTVDLSLSGTEPLRALRSRRWWTAT
ncbi:MAG: hypothetical protein ACLR4Z_03325 [Butyricicoccaceae bacterium]